MSLVRLELFTCSGLIGLHLSIDALPLGLIVTRLLRLTPPIHYSQQKRRREAPCHLVEAGLLFVASVVYLAEIHTHVSV